MTDSDNITDVFAFYFGKLYICCIAKNIIHLYSKSYDASVRKLITKLKQIVFSK